MTEIAGGQQNDGQAEKRERHSGFKTAIALLAFAVCWVLWFLSTGNWFVTILLYVVGCVCGEYLGEKYLNKPWFERLSVEHSGFSVARIILGVVVVLAISALIIVARLALLRVFS